LRCKVYVKKINKPKMVELDFCNDESKTKSLLKLAEQLEISINPSKILGLCDKDEYILFLNNLQKLCSIKTIVLTQNNKLICKINEIQEIEEQIEEQFEEQIEIDKEEKKLININKNNKSNEIFNKSIISRMTNTKSSPNLDVNNKKQKFSSPLRGSSIIDKPLTEDVVRGKEKLSQKNESMSFEKLNEKVLENVVKNAIKEVVPIYKDIHNVLIELLNTTKNIHNIVIKINENIENSSRKKKINVQRRRNQRRR